MKKRLHALLLVVCMIFAAVLSLTSCDEQSAMNAPQKLTAPVVTLNGNVVTWSADANAEKFEISLDGELSYVESSVIEKVLTEGQTFKIRAVGNETTYSTSDWSNSVTYTADSSGAQPGKLVTPTVTISGTGLASWTAVANASGYVYKLGDGAETPTTATSVQLADGQSIAVKAIGDGSTYTDSDYSASKTYTAGASSPTEAPTYLGIFASNHQPSEADGLPDALAARPMMMSYRMTRSGTYRSFGTVLEEYFANSGNHLNGNFPKESDYDVYAKTGETVYVQIWLNNPNQHTILSLKLNGTKYQVGGGLSSFFVEKEGQHYNCIYVALTVPSNLHSEAAYTVTDIEYIADTYINADGTDRFMNENNTVKIGLPYQGEKPRVSDYSELRLR